MDSGYAMVYFNPRSREGSDISDNCNNFRMIRFQSTLPRRERQSSLTEFSCVLMISIHAPAKGATISCPSKVLFCNISIHAPAKGATYLLPAALQAQRFQSTLPRRERLKSEQTKYTTLLISIHAPAKGATIMDAFTDPRVHHFNPRSREGSDSNNLELLEDIQHFNPRSREGSDLSVPIPSLGRCYFNPRSREGSDELGI